MPPARSSHSSKASRPRASTASRQHGPASKRRKLATSENDGGIEQERWLNPEDLDVEPPKLNFQPKNPVGPRIDLSATWSPLSLFKLFFSANVIHTIINNTNANAERKKASGQKFQWSPLSMKDFWLFLAIVVFSGLVQVHTRAGMWKTEWPYNFTFPRSHMTRERFEAIVWSLHLCSLEDDERNERKKGTSEYDRLLKIKPLYNQIIDACTSLFQPGREIAIDERMVKSKARIGFRQFMKNKPVKFGYKLFVLADSQTGYTWNFFIYQGKSVQNTERQGLSFTSVTDLMKFDLLGKGYHLYVDNFYTSPALFERLLNNGTVACGTIRQSRIGFPKTTQNDLPVDAARGDMRWLRRDNLLFLKWKDTKTVSMCSSFHKAFSGDTIRRRVKEAGQWRFRDIPIPDSIKDYNQHMGGVDLSDALIQYYSVQWKTKIWYKTFFYHFVDIAIVNSYILFKFIRGRRSEKVLTQKQFREALMKEMVAEAGAPTSSAAPRPTVSSCCMPLYYGGNATDLRKVCVVCRGNGKKVKTPIYCSVCNVALCLTSNRNCFIEYHL